MIRVQRDRMRVRHREVRPPAAALDDPRRGVLGTLGADLMARDGHAAWHRRYLEVHHTARLDQLHRRRLPQPQLHEQRVPPPREAPPQPHVPPPVDLRDVADADVVHDPVRRAAVAGQLYAFRPECHALRALRRIVVHEAPISSSSA